MHGHWLLSPLLLFLLSSDALLAFNAPDMPLSSYQQLAACLYVNGLPTPGETVYFQSTVTLGSGYHSHTAGRPKGSFYTWTGNEFGSAVTQSDGCAYIYWYAPAAAGSHTILA